jgi:L-amino acid N-acyltransferase YncA
MPIQIRLVRETDAGDIAAIYAPVVEHTPISFEVAPPSGDDMARRIAETWPAYPWLVCEIDGRVAGYAYASSHSPRAAYRWSVNTSVYIDAAWRRCGVGRGLYESLLGILAAQGYVNAYAGVTLPNAASVGLHEAMGFEPVGVYRQVGYKAGAWHDVGWWQRALRPHETAPAPTLPLGAVCARGEWDALLGRGARAIRVP